MTTTQGSRADRVRTDGAQVQIVSGEYRGHTARSCGAVSVNEVKVFDFDSNGYRIVHVSDLDVAETEMPRTTYDVLFRVSTGRFAGMPDYITVVVGPDGNGKPYTSESDIPKIIAVRLALNEADITVISLGKRA